MFHPKSQVSLTSALLFIGLGVSGCGGGTASTTIPGVQPNAEPGDATVTLRARATTSMIGRRVDAMTKLSATVLGDKPVAYLPMSDTTYTLTDAGPHAFTGTYGSSVTRGVAVTLGASSAAKFPGGTSYNANGYAAIAPNTTFQSPHVSVEAWFSLDAANTSGHDQPLVIYGSVDRGVRYGMLIHSLGSGQQCLVYQQHNAGTASINHTGTVRFIVGTTYHVVAVSDGANVSIYVNGVLDSSFPFAGSIDYSQQLADGLQIGGAHQAGNGAGSFPGTIGQVAVYNTALTQAAVENHFLAGQMVPLLTETPANTDAFVDSIGVNAHFDNPTAVYSTQFPAVQKLLVASGIRHIREAFSFDTLYLQEMTSLGNAGVRASYLTDLYLTKSQIQQFPSLVGSSFEQYEAPNEQDDVGNPDWLAQCKSFQTNLYSWVKSDPQTAKYPVLGPALTSNKAYAAVGDLSAHMDYGNMHDYFGVFNPGTTGWGGVYPPFGTYGSISYNENISRLVDGAKPIMSTESGYGTQPGNPLNLDYYAQVRYMTRLFFEQFNASVARTYSYEFVDAIAGGPFGWFGMVQSDLTPKPGYYGVKSIIAELSDPGPRFAGTPLSFQISGFVNNVHHTLMQRRNGSYVLAIWLELPAWVTKNNAGGDINVPEQNVTLTTSRRFSSGTMTALHDDGSLQPGGFAWTGNTAYVSVSDKIKFIELKP